VTDGGPRKLEPVLRRSLLLAGLLGVAGIAAMYGAAQLDDPDFWWHLRAGEWTVAHGAVPDLETFSANHANERWVAYSWLYDLVLAVLHARFGLLAQVLLAVALALAIAGCLHSLLLRLSKRPPVAALLTLVGVLAMARMIYGRSTMFTVLLAILEIRLLYEALAFERRRALFLVPLVIAVWSNLHVQFVYGLFVLGCFVAQAFVDRKSMRPWTAAFTLSLLATLANPYGWRIYEPFVLYLRQSAAIYDHIQELRAPGFRSLESWALLGIVLAVAWSIGRNGVKRPFLLLLAGVAAVIAFRSARDAWFAAVTALPLLATSLERANQEPEARSRALLVAVGAAVFLACGSVQLDLSEKDLEAQSAKSFPADAAAWIESHRQPGPILNHYDWGGYLLWRLPAFPVSVDGRSYVYTADYFERSLALWRAEPGWESSPLLQAADLVVGKKTLPLTTLLEKDPRFERTYDDAIAAVYVRRR
jgi:hypothetical protein